MKSLACRRTGAACTRPNRGAFVDAPRPPQHPQTSRTTDSPVRGPLDGLIDCPPHSRYLPLLIGFTSRSRRRVTKSKRPLGALDSEAASRLSGQPTRRDGGSYMENL